MLGTLVTAVLLSAVALGLTFAAIRGKWIVFRLAVGTVAFVFVMIAFAAWMAIVFVSRAGPQVDHEGQMYIGWDPRFLFGWSGLFWVVLFVGFLTLILWLGNRRQRKGQQGKG